MKELGKRYLSRKFVLALISSIVAFGNAMWNWGLAPLEVLLIISPLLGYIGVEGLADIEGRKKK